MTRELAAVGVIALAFAIVPYWITGELGWFSAANFALGGLALAAAVGLGVAGLRGADEPVFRRALGRGVLGLLLCTVAAVALERAAAWTGVSFDLSFEHKYALSDATRKALGELGSVRASLYGDPFDPRIRSTRFLLRAMAETGHLTFDEKRLEEHPDEEDCFAIGSSNTVVLRRGDGPPCQSRFETVERPTEGTLFEALYRLRSVDRRTLYVSRGAGEGDLESRHETGYSGLASALLTEGYRVRQFVLAATDRVPDEADAVVVIAPRRPLRPEALDALDGYLARGGSLVAFLEPGVESGLAGLLERWGMASPDALVVDPASGPVEGDPAGVNPLAYTYAAHPVAQGLGENRMTFFPGTRAFRLHKPEPDDKLEPLVYASPRAWLAPEPLAVLAAGVDPVPPPGAQGDFPVLVAAGRYPRSGGEARIVGFGDAGLASNRYLRTLYNLDLVMNAIHWASEQEPDITLRPKLRAAVAGGSQFPIPLQNTLTMFQSLGLLLPELLLVVGAMVWLRSRAA